MNKQQLASKIWASANKMRSKIEANEYKDYILGFIFYKFLSDKEVKYLKEIGYSDDDLETLTEDDEAIVINVQQNVGYFIAYNNLFSTWLKMGSDFSVVCVRDALSAFSRLINGNHKKVFDGIFVTLQTGLSKLGDTDKSRTKSISDLLQLIKDIPMDGKQDYDVLGFIYEYLISNFAANAGKKAGEFYTPHEVSILMSEIVADHLKDKENIKIYDPTSGSGSLLINIGKAVAKYTNDSNKIKYYAQELKENTYNLTRMNLVMRGIIPDNIVTRNGDTLEDDWPYFEDGKPETYDPLYVDAVVSNPPYSQNWNPADKDSDPRYKRFGLAPKSKADYAFLLHDLYHIKGDGIMTIVLPHGVLFRGNEEGEIRKNLIENNHIDAVIGLPANIFFGTGIPTIIMVLRQKRERTDVLIVDASKGFEKVGKNNKLRASDIKKIVDVVTQRIDVPKFSRVVPRDEIRANEYNLNIPRYVDSSEKAESWDIYATMFGGIPSSEISEFSSYWQAFPTLKESIFSWKNDSYASLQSDNVKTSVSENMDLKNFVQQYKSSFDGFSDYLKQELIDAMENVNIASEESILCKDIFNRLDKIPLVDAYEGYQILDDEWNKIAVDLEIIQTEGLSAVRQVDPHMVIKKKDGKEQEVQDGWIGHVLPFELVQSYLLPSDLSALKTEENKLNEIVSRYEEALDLLPDDEKDKPFVNGDNTAFVWGEVKKVLKAKNASNDVLSILAEAEANHKKETKLKKIIKQKSTELHLKTKKTIETLSDNLINELLYAKWITPLCNELLQLPEGVISELSSSLDGLAQKYSTTLHDVESQTEKVEDELSFMINELSGAEYDTQGLLELQKMLGGKLDE